MFTVFLFALAATSDSFIIGLNYGLRKVTIPFVSNLLIAFICFAGTYFSMIAGSVLARFLSVKTADIVGSFILLGLGSYMLLQSLRTGQKDRCDSESIDADHSKVIEWKEAVILGGFLCLNNIGVGIGASISGMGALPTSVFCAVMSFLFILTGYRAGLYVNSRCFQRILEICSAGILIFLGVFGIISCLI